MKNNNNNKMKINITKTSRGSPKQVPSPGVFDYFMVIDVYVNNYLWPLWLFMIILWLLIIICYYKMTVFKIYWCSMYKCHSGLCLFVIVDDYLWLFVIIVVIDNYLWLFVIYINNYFWLLWLFLRLLIIICNYFIMTC